MNEELARYYGIILEALENVDNSYYNIPTTFNSEGIVRERVFCYEFYHQLRCLAKKDSNTNIKINGEIDKRGHELFDEDDQKNPDFIFHLPGTMEKNLIIVEVKGKMSRGKNGCIKDFKTLKTFLEKYQYKIGIFILYNHDLMAFSTEFKEELKEIFLENDELEEISKRIFVICKNKQEESIEEKRLFDIICEEESIELCDVKIKKEKQQ